MNKRHISSMASIALSLVSGVCTTASHGQNGSSSTVTSMCSIAQNPKAFEDQSVTVKARVISDGVHGTALYDDSCASFALYLFVSDDAKGRTALDTALNWCHRSTSGKVIEGTFTGIVQLKDKTPFQKRITVQRIEDLSVRSTHTASASFPRPCSDPPPLDLR